MLVTMQRNWISQTLLMANVKWYSYSGEHCRSFLKSETCTYHMTQQLYSCALIPEKCKSTSTQKLYMIIFSGFICNNPQTEANKVSLTR